MTSSADLMLSALEEIETARTLLHAALDRAPREGDNLSIMDRMRGAQSHLLDAVACATLAAEGVTTRSPQWDSCVAATLTVAMRAECRKALDHRCPHVSTGN